MKRHQIMLTALAAGFLAFSAVPALAVMKITAINHTQCHVQALP